MSRRIPVVGAGEVRRSEKREGGDEKRCRLAHSVDGSGMRIHFVPTFRVGGPRSDTPVRRETVAPFCFFCLGEITVAVELLKKNWTVVVGGWSGKPEKERRSFCRGPGGAVKSRFGPVEQARWSPDCKARPGGNSMHQILLVEDDDLLREGLRQVLEEDDCRVQTAVEGAEALDLLRTTGVSPCVVLLDLMMPGMNGWDFLRLLGAHPVLSKIPIIVTSAYPFSEKEVVPGVVLHKPFSIARLKQVIETACLGHEPSSETDARPHV
ncbi:MAG: hypothetical protein DMF54_04205 [Acidobacteria bacterium]|nr:MAG: hypothetical protein DMF54_04205 [Acidobacteriota bacterium]